MARLTVRPWIWVAVAAAGMVLLAACAPQQQAPAAQPAKPAAEPAKPAAPPAAQPAKPAAEAPKPAAEAPKPAAQAPKPAAQAPKPAAQAKVELRAGCNNPKEDVLCVAVDKFAEIVNQKSNGEVLVRVFYAGALGIEQQLTQSVMTGSVDIGMISNGNAARFTNAYFVYDLPFLFKNYDNMLKSLETPIGKKSIEQFEKDVSVKMLYVISYGMARDINTRNKPLKTPADIKGLKIRVISSPIDLATFKAWGANPTPVDWAQTYAALQQGVVDGENIPLVSLLGAKHYEVVKQSIRLDYQALLQNFFINQKKFDSLSPAHQKAIMDAAAEAKAWQYKEAVEMVKRTIKQLTDYGVNIYTPTADEYGQWAAIREKVWAEVAEQFKDKLDLRVANELYRAQ